MRKLVLVLSASFLVAVSALATEVRVRPDGVSVKTDGVSVDADAGGATVDTPDVHVEADAAGASVEVGDGDATVGAPDAHGRKASGAFTCKDNEERTLKGVSIKAKKDGIVVAGNCVLTLADSVIVAGGYGIVVRDNGELKMSHTSVRGKKGAILVDNNATVTGTGNTYQGKITVKANGDLERDGNTFRK